MTDSSGIPEGPGAMAVRGDENGDDNGGRPEAVRDLRRSEQRFRLLVDSVIDYAIFMLDPDGVIGTWNAGAARVKGYDADEVIGQHYSIFYPSESRRDGLPERLLDQALRDGRVEHTGWRLRKDGSRFWADVVITALYDDGRHTGFAKVTRDRTKEHELEVARERTLADQRELVERLEELDAWRRDFVDSVSHDLQNPVAAIDGFVRLLDTGGVHDSEVPIVVDSLLTNTRALQELIDNLRASTVLTERDQPLRREPFELRPFVERIVAATSPLFGECHPDIDVADNVDVDADRHGLERILRNLLANAARHTPAGTKVVIRGRRDGRDTVIEVADDGPGIDPELLPRIFDRFESGAHGGTGLGLAIVYRWVELHGGTIAVDSAPGEGATFRFVLPES